MLYTGDDQRQQFIYKVVSTEEFDHPDNRKVNVDLLDDAPTLAAQIPR